MNTSTTGSSTPGITLVTLGSAFGLRNVSPFCLKVEMLLHSLGLPFTEDIQPDPRKAPKGKLPYVEIEGEQLADSELITQRLNEITQGGVYAGLTPADISKGTALTRLAEDHLYWIMVASRWLDDNWWPNIVREFFHIAPAPLRPLVAALARREVKQTYHLQGLGRHSLEDQQGFARRDLQALQDAITDDGFLCGATPNVFDFTVTGLLAGIYDQQPPTWISHIAQEFQALKDYAERVQAHMGIYGRKLD